MLGQLRVSHKRVRDSSIFANLLLRFFISFSFRFINFTFTHKYVNNLLTLRSSRAALRSALLCSTLAAPGALSIFVFISAITNLRRVGHFVLLYRLTLEGAPCGPQKHAILECLEICSRYIICLRRKLNNFPFHFPLSCGPAIS